jgi:hypothetical protein
MLLNRLTQDEIDRIRGGNMEILRKALEEEEKLLVDRLLEEKKDVQFIQGATKFCRALRLVIK